MTTQQPNGLTIAALEDVAKELGEQAGKGKDTQVKFLLKIVEGAYHGTLDLDPNSCGQNIDHAQHLASIYVKAQTGATVFDAKAPNQRKTISCMRTCIKLGSWPKGGNGEPLATVNELMTQRQKLRNNPATAKKVDDAANTLLRYARQQIKQDQLIDRADLGEFCVKPMTQHATSEEVLSKLYKGLKDLYNGKASNSTAVDSSKHVADAMKSVKSRLDEIASLNRPAAKVTQLKQGRAA